MIRSASAAHRKSCHHLVHEGGWSLTLGDRREVTIHRPDGIRHYADTTTNRQPTTRAG